MKYAMVVVVMSLFAFPVQAQMLMDMSVTLGATGAATGKVAPAAPPPAAQPTCVSGAACKGGQQCTSSDNKKCVCSYLPKDPKKKLFLYCR